MPRSRVRPKNRIGAPLGDRVLSTKYTDQETGLVMYPYRPYSPSLGRFLCRDPMGERAGGNRYRYVNNDPIRRMDPLGLFSRTEPDNIWVSSSGDFSPKVVVAEAKKAGLVKVIYAYIDANPNWAIQYDYPEVINEIYKHRGNPKNRADINTPAFIGAGFEVEFVPADNKVKETFCCKSIYWEQDYTGADDDYFAVDFPGELAGVRHIDYTLNLKLRLYCKRNWRRDLLLYEIAWSTHRTFNGGPPRTATVNLTIDW